MTHKMTDEEFREYVSSLLYDHGSPFISDLPKDEYDCCVDEVGNAVFLYTINKAKEACSANGGATDETYRRLLDQIPNPFRSQ